MPCALQKISSTTAPATTATQWRASAPVARRGASNPVLASLSRGVIRRTGDYVPYKRRRVATPLEARP